MKEHLNFLPTKFELGRPNNNRDIATAIHTRDLNDA